MKEKLKKLHSEKKPLFLADIEVKGLRNTIMNDVPRIVFVFKLSLGWKELVFWLLPITLAVPSPQHLSRHLQ